MQQPSLIVYLTKEVLLPVSQKGLFSGQYILFGNYLEQLQNLLEISCALGYTYRGNIRPLLNLFSEHGKVDNVLEFLDTAATEQFNSFQPDYKNWWDFFFNTEAISLTQKYQDGNILPVGKWYNPKVYNTKIPFKLAMVNPPTLSAIWIGFGYKYPEIVEKLFSFDYNPQEWHQKYQSGLDIGEKPPQKRSLTDTQKVAKELLKPFVKKYYSLAYSILELNK